MAVETRLQDVKAQQESPDGLHMQRALDLAARSVGQASPNPQVGCVLVRASGGLGGEVLGEGAHHYAAWDHAEIVALKDAAARGNGVRGATAFVTLEPCSHHGRTGPCVDALIAAGVARVVVATLDPNPLVSGSGVARLRSAGIDVEVGVLESEARALNLSFAHFIQHRRPFVTLKAALSIDGHLAPSPELRAAEQPFWLTGQLAREEVHRLRHGADAILTGIGTVVADNPALTDRSGLPRRRRLLRVILDPQLRTPQHGQLISSACAHPEQEPPDLLLFCSSTAPLARQRALESAAEDRLEIVRLASSASGRLSLPEVLMLLAERDCTSVMLEAGSALNSAFLHEDLVDRVVLFFSRTELGHGSVPFAAGGPSPYLLQQRLQGMATAELGDDVMVTGLLHDPWSRSE